MKKKYIFLLLAALVITTLIFTLSGCAGSDENFEGKNIYTYEINGGTLNYGTSSTKNNINLVFHPGTYAIDPTNIPNYKISRSGYKFTGWYTSKDCKPSEKWDFEAAVVDKDVTLYAGWELEIKYTYGIYYMNGSEKVSLGTYKVDSGETFSDSQGMANKRLNYTPIGYYTDPELKAPWNAEYKHPGGDKDLEIPVYVKYIEGNWKLVDSYLSLQNAIESGNVYLTADIDCAGNVLDVPDTFSKIFEGNGFTVSNFVAEQKSKNLRNPSCAIFEQLSAEAVIRNVKFENVTYEFTNIKQSTESVTVVPEFAALAVSIKNGAKVDSVSVSGTLNINVDANFASLNAAYYYVSAENSEVSQGITKFVADIKVVKKS